MSVGKCLLLCYFYQKFCPMSGQAVVDFVSLLNERTVRKLYCSPTFFLIMKIGLWLSLDQY